MATAHTSRFGSFANNLAAVAGRDGYVRYSKRDVDRIKAWINDNITCGDDTDDDESSVEAACAAEFPSASRASIMVAHAESGIEGWQGRR